MDLCCPACRQELHEAPEAFRCVGCERVFPVVAGIPDLRLCADPYISIEADREKALHLAERAERLSFVELLAYYYEITDDVTPDLAALYTAHQAAARERAWGVLRRLERYFGEGLAAEDRLLDLGCGLAGLVAATRESGGRPVGLDIALRWLVVARAQLAEAGVRETPLVCACADHLPFGESTFDWVVAEGLLEHVAAGDRVLAEAQRVLAPAGRFMARTVNRLAVGPEPHLNLWWAGYLPPVWRDRYARYRRGRDYSRLHLRSRRELENLSRRAGDVLRLVPPQILDGDLAHQSPVRQTLMRFYSRLIRLPVLGGLVERVGPYLDLISKPT